MAAGRKWCFCWYFRFLLVFAHEPVKLKKRKDVTYETLLRNYIFVPIAVETFGSWGTRGLKFIKEIGRKIQEKTGNKNATSHIIQAISRTVQRGNATSIMHY